MVWEVECEVRVVSERSTELPIGEGEGKRGEQPVRRKGWPSSTNRGRDTAFVHYANAGHPVNKPVYKRGHPPCIRKAALVIAAKASPSPHATNNHKKDKEINNNAIVGEARAGGTTSHYPASV